MATYFEKILTDGAAAGKVPAKTQDARNWYRDSAKNVGRIRNEKTMHRAEPDRLTTLPLVGRMYMFFYDPKYKEELPYYDRYPLIFPFRRVQGGFFGLNLHYLPLQYRARLMDELYRFSNNKRYDESTRLRMSYQLLKSASQTKYYVPCVKQYLNAHLRSQFYYVKPEEWDIALFLPLERFVKKTKTQVWSESKKIIRSA